MRRFSAGIAGLVALIVAISLASPAFAKVVDEKMRSKVLAKKGKPSHSKKLTLGATGSANSSDNVVGAANGTTMQIGILLAGEHKYVDGKHAVETAGKIQHARTRTPLLDAFVKSADVFELQSTWMYAMNDSPPFGPFARVKAASQVFNSVDVRATKVTVKKTAVDGTVSSEDVGAEIATPTTNAFEPLILTETAGLFANPISVKVFTLKAKLGAGAQQIIARDGYTVTGYDKDSKTVSLKQIETSGQAGGEFELDAAGQLSQTVAWAARAAWFMPLYSSAIQQLEGMDALQTDIAASISIKLSDWAKLDYVANIKRIPLVVEGWQVQHGLMLTAGFNLL